MSKISVEIISLFEGLALPLAQRGEPSPWGPGMMGNWGYGMMGWFGAIMMLVFWGLIIFVLILLAFMNYRFIVITFIFLVSS